MINSLTDLFKKRPSEEGRLGVVPEGIRIYAVGDIHGRRDLLIQLLDLIKCDARDYEGAVHIVFVGDYIDRGPDSKGVIDVLLHDLPKEWKAVFLRGNHEQALLDFMKAPTLRFEWLAWGGLQALESYDVAPYGPHGSRDPAALAAEFQFALQESGHEDFYIHTELSYECGSYLFVHAGVRSGIPLKSQMPDDLLFIREDFMNKPHELPYRIVFGHTILNEPLVEYDRIGLDTGAFQTGRLTAVCLQADTAYIIQTSNNNT